MPKSIRLKAALKSGLKMVSKRKKMQVRQWNQVEKWNVQITGLTHELMYPSHKNVFITTLGRWFLQDSHKGISNAKTKNGNQQMTKRPEKRQQSQFNWIN